MTRLADIAPEWADLEHELRHLATVWVEDDGFALIPIDDDEGPPTERTPAVEPAPDTVRAPAGYPYAAEWQGEAYYYE